MPYDVHLENGEIHLEPSAMARWERYFANTPGHRKMRDLIVEYATAQGGVTLEYWKRSNGHYFGDPLMQLPETIAEQLNLAVSELDKIIAATWAWVWPRLSADPDYMELDARLREAGRRRAGESS